MKQATMLLSFTRRPIVELERNSEVALGDLGALARSLHWNMPSTSARFSWQHMTQICVKLCTPRYSLPSRHQRTSKIRSLTGRDPTHLYNWYYWSIFTIGTTDLTKNLSTKSSGPALTKPKELWYDDEQLDENILQKKNIRKYVTEQLKMLKIVL